MNDTGLNIFECLQTHTNIFMTHGIGIAGSVPVRSRIVWSVALSYELEIENNE